MLISWRVSILVFRVSNDGKTCRFDFFERHHFAPLEASIGWEWVDADVRARVPGGCLLK